MEKWISLNQKKERNLKGLQLMEWELQTLSPATTTQALKTKNSCKIQMVKMSCFNNKLITVKKMNNCLSLKLLEIHKQDIQWMEMGNRLSWWTMEKPSFRVKEHILVFSVKTHITVELQVVRNLWMKKARLREVKLVSKFKLILWDCLI